ncbi:hypothetical protein J6590_084445 [Homalodisca vitripennis]|nr:hypothetical protein J6590_084445 [Homalodisca vitripennis]
MVSRYEENETEAGSRLELPKKWSKEGPLAFKASSMVTSEPVEKDYLKELETVKENLKTAKLDMEEATVKPASAVLYLEESEYFWHLHMPSTNFVRTQDSEGLCDVLLCDHHDDLEDRFIVTSGGGVVLHVQNGIKCKTTSAFLDHVIADRLKVVEKTGVIDALSVLD